MATPAARCGSEPSHLGIEAIEDVIEAVRRPVSRVLSPARMTRADGWPFIWDARRRTPRATYPDGGAETRPIETDLPSLLGLAPGGVCRAAPVAGGAVRSYRTLSPLPAFAPGGASVGGLLSVALSLGSPPPGVTRHRVSVEPGLSSPGAGAEPGRRERPSGRLTTSTPRSPEGPRQPGSARPRGARRSRRPPRRSRPRGGSGAGRPRARPRSPGPGNRSRRRPARA